MSDQNVGFLMTRLKSFFSTSLTQVPRDKLVGGQMVNLIDIFILSFQTSKDIKLSSTFDAILILVHSEASF